MAQGTSFDQQTQTKLIRWAVLRGCGTYLWPDLDPATRFGSRDEARNAYIVYLAITDGIYPGSVRGRH